MAHKHLSAQAKNRSAKSVLQCRATATDSAGGRIVPGNTRIAHSGGLPGFGSEWRIYPEYNMGVISFSNHTYGAPGLPNAIVLDTLIQLAGLTKRELRPSAILNQRKAEIVALFPEWTDSDKQSIFAENFWMDSDLAHRKAWTQQVFKEAGAIRNVTDLKPRISWGTFLIECEKKM